jgi:hypothetical protein
MTYRQADQRKAITRGLSVMRLDDHSGVAPDARHCDGAPNELATHFERVTSIRQVVEVGRRTSRCRKSGTSTALFRTSTRVISHASEGLSGGASMFP